MSDVEIKHGWLRDDPGFYGTSLANTKFTIPFQNMPENADYRAPKANGAPMTGAVVR
jgi:hypothetical protein